MRAARWWVLAGVLGVSTLGCHDLFAPGLPDGFDGWFHVPNGPDRAVSILFDNGGVFRLRNYGCADPQTLDLSWGDSGSSAAVVFNLGPGTTFTADGQGNLIATPAVFTTDGGVETWTRGAQCLICSSPPVVLACDNPSVLDGGT